MMIKKKLVMEEVLRESELAKRGPKKLLTDTNKSEYK